MKNLKSFKNTLQKRKDTLLEILHSHNSDIKIINSNTLKDDSDVISASMQGQLDTLLIEKYTQELKEIEKSLQKITQGIYGICEMCDDMIDEERLRAKPHARFCIVCREIYEKDKKAKLDKEKRKCNEA